MKNLVYGLWACLCLLGCAQQQPAGKYTLKGNIKGLKDGTILQLVPFAHHEEPVLTETSIKEGKFIFEGTVLTPRLMILRVKDCYGKLDLMLEDKNIFVDGTVTCSFVGKDSLPIYNFSAMVKGSPLTDYYKRMMSPRDSLDRIRKDFQKRYNDFTNAYSKAYTDKDAAKMQELMDSEIGKNMQKEDKEFFQAMEKNYNRIILENKETFWGPLALIALTSYLTPDQKNLYEQFSQEAKDSYYGKMVYEELYPAGRVGQPVPAFTVKEANGKEHSLQSLLEGRKYALIDFWASWCGPCRKEIPNLKDAYAKFADKGFQIISISTDKKESDWKKALDEEKLTWPNFRSNEVAGLYKVKAIPTMYLVDSKGVLIALDLRGKALIDKLTELFHE